MSSPNPKPLPQKSTFEDEVNKVTSFNDAYRFLQPKKIKVSKNSPPHINDVDELEHVFDKTTKKLWTKIDGALVYTQYA
jgi:hypothetical protein